MRVLDKRQRGIFALWLVVLLPALIALFALLLESTYLLAIRHRQQTAADAAALGGAYQILRNDESGILAAGTYAAAANGFPPSGMTTLAVSHPPGSGGYIGEELTVRVRLEHRPARLLAAIAPGIDLLVGTSATAKFRRSTCMLTLSPSGAASLNIANDAVIDGRFCSAQVNSATNGALRVRNRANVDLLDLRVVGSATVHAGASVQPIPVTGAAAIVDPLLTVPEPVASGCDHTDLVVSGTVTLSPGTYCGGLRISVGSRANLQAGNYLFVGGRLDLRNLAIIAGDEVTLFLLQGAYLQSSASATVMLAAPESGDHAGVVIFESRSAPLDTATHALSMSSQSLLEGIVYLPRSRLSVTSYAVSPANDGARNLILVARNISLSGRIRINVDLSLVPEMLRSDAWLVE